MQAGFREVDGASVLAVARLETVHPVEPGATGIRRVGVLVGKRGGIPARIPFLAVHDTGVTAHTGIEIDNETEAFVGSLLGK